MSNSYKDYLTAYTAHHNRQAAVYGGKIITEEEAEQHEVVKGIKQYYEEMERSHGGRDQPK